MKVKSASSARSRRNQAKEPLLSEAEVQSFVLRCYQSMKRNESSPKSSRKTHKRASSSSSTVSSPSDPLDETRLSQILQKSDEDFANTVANFQRAIANRPATSINSKGVIPAASENAITQLPRARILPSDKDDFIHDESSCSICCGRLIDGVALTRLPCGHILHSNCAISWLVKSCTCPECRYELPTNSSIYEPGRIKRMNKRQVVTCGCARACNHECFFRDPSRSLLDQCSNSQ